MRLLPLLLVLVILTGCYIPRNGLYENKDGIRYYENDVYLTGWINVDGSERYFSKVDGYMLTNSKTIDGVWWGIDKDGKKANGFLQDEDGVRYYEDGVYSVGWVTIDGREYYFKKESGLMATGKINIGGKEYTFLPDGVLTDQ